MSALAKAPGSIIGGEERAPLVFEDPERAKKLEELRDVIGKKMASKFKTVRQCFHYIDVEHKGSIVREDIHRLFKNFHLHRSFGVTDMSFADDFYDLLNLDGNEEIDFHELQAFLGPYVHPGHCPTFVSSADPGSGFASHIEKGKYHPIEQHDNVKNMFMTSYDGFLSDRHVAHVPSGLMPGYGGFVPRALPGKPRTHETPDVLVSRRTSEFSECSTPRVPFGRAASAPNPSCPVTEPPSGTTTPPMVQDQPAGFKKLALGSLATQLGDRRRHSKGASARADEESIAWAQSAWPNCTPRDSFVYNTPRRNSGHAAGWTPRNLPPLQNQEHVLRRLNEASMTVGSSMFSGLGERRRASK